MKKIFVTILWMILAGVSWYLAAEKWTEIRKNPEAIRNIQTKIWGPCSRPLAYSLGTLDPRFGISESNFLTEVQAAENVWEKASGRNLFEYAPDSAFKINLVFDSRQEQVNEFKKLQDSFQETQNVQKNLRAQYDALYSRYKKKLEEYNRGAEEYKNDLEKYLKDVNYWNTRGGAPEDEYDKLKAEQNALEKKAKALKDVKKTIDALAEQINRLSKREKNLVEEYNQRARTYSEKFGGPKEFDQGIYTGKEINVYQFRENSDLELVLAHELGHYLGIGHLNDSQSVMYYLMDRQDLDNIQPTEEDIKAVEDVCK